MNKRGDYDKAEKNLNYLKEKYSGENTKVGQIFEELGVLNKNRGNFDIALDLVKQRICLFELIFRKYKPPRPGMKLTISLKNIRNFIKSVQ